MLLYFVHNLTLTNMYIRDDQILLNRCLDPPIFTTHICLIFAVSTPILAYTVTPCYLMFLLTRGGLTFYRVPKRRMEINKVSGKLQGDRILNKGTGRV